MTCSCKCELRWSQPRTPAGLGGRGVLRAFPHPAGCQDGALDPRRRRLGGAVGAGGGGGRSAISWGGERGRGKFGLVAVVDFVLSIFLDVLLNADGKWMRWRRWIER